LPPGQYLIDQFAFAGGGICMVRIDWSSAVPFSVRFTIKPGEASCIGTFMRAPSVQTPSESKFYGALFLIANRRMHNVQIANAKVPTLVSITTDVTRFGSIVLRRDEPRRCQKGAKKKKWRSDHFEGLETEVLVVSTKAPKAPRW
jgi:hypothetical protein